MPTIHATGLEVTVIDDSDRPGWLAGATRINEIYMHDVKSMVKNVLAYLYVGRGKLKKIARLNIIDHGTPWGFQIGQERVNLGNFARATAEMVKLKPHFAKNGFTHMQHCEIGQSKILMVKMARLLGVDVYASTGYHSSLYRLNAGGPATVPFEDYVVAKPNGLFQKTSRPELFDVGDIRINLPFLPNLTIDL